MPFPPGVAARFYYRLADVCLDFHWYELAARAYERVLRGAPDDRYARARHAWTLLHVPHRRNEGITTMRLLLLAIPDSDGYGRLGYALWEERRYEEAAHAFREAVRLHPEDAAHHYGLGVTLVKLGRPEETVDACREALRLGHPEAAHLHSLVGDNLFALDRSEEAVEAYREAIRLSEPPTADLHYNLGISLAALGRSEEAVQAYREAIRLGDPPTADLYYKLGVSLLSLDRFEEALEAFRSAARIDPSDSEAWAGIGSTLVFMGRLNEALEFIRRAVELNPSYSEAWADLGSTLAILGRWKDAVPCLERAMRLTPTPITAFDLGDTWYELNRLEEAERVLRDGLALDDDSADEEAVKPRIRWLLAFVVSDQGRHAEAIGLAREICASNPDLGSSRAVLASVLCEAGRTDEALIEAKAAVSAAPTALECLGVLCSILVTRNDGAAALEVVERLAASLEPEINPLHSAPWVRCLACRGAALSLLGRHQEALAAFEEVLRSYPGFFERWTDLAPHYALSSREGGHDAVGESP